MKIRTALLAATAGTLLMASLVRGQAQSSFDPTAEDKARNSANTNSVDHPYKPTNYYQTTMAPPRRQTARHLLYVAEPGGTANGMLPYPNGGTGIVVLDADHNYQFLKRINWDLPASQLPGPTVSGIAASAVTNMLYVAFRGSLVAYDLTTDKVAWTQNGSAVPVKNHYNQGAPSGCCERPWVLPDGKTIIVGSSYNNWWYVVDGVTGAIKGQIDAPESPLAHNMAVTPDGKTAFLSSLTQKVSVADVASMKVLRTITFSDAVRPVVINHDGSRVYVNVNNLLGFEIGDGNTGKFLKRVEAPAEMWKAKWADPNQHFFGHGGPAHGLGMTPDESEMWSVDNINYGILVWDNQGGDNWVYDPAKSFKTTYAAGWITMTNDGKLAFLGSGDIVDVRAHKIIGQMKDEFGHVLGSEKLLYMAFDNGKLVETDNQFANGDPKAFAERATGDKKAASR